MPPQTGPSLLILVAFILPEFVTVLIKERTHETSAFERLLLTAYYSVWSYLLLAVIALAFCIGREEIEAFYDRHTDDPAGLDKS